MPDDRPVGAAGALTTEAFLGEMLALFREGAGWTKRTMARGADGQPTNFADEGATRFCLAGATMHLIYARRRTVQGEGPLTRLQRVTGATDLSIWNDQQENFGTVKAAIQAAMEDGK